MKLRLVQKGRYTSVVNGCLLIALAAILSTEVWPGFAWLAQTVAVLAGCVALSAFFLTSSGASPVERRDKVAFLASELSANPPGLATGSSTWNRLVSANELANWFEHYGKIKPTSPPMQRKIAGSEFLRTKALLESQMEPYVKLSRSHFGPSPHYFRPYKTPLLKAWRTDWSKPKEETFGLADKKGRFVVTVGPVTIEITEEETKVHVAPSKKVTTTLTGQSTAGAPSEQQPLLDTRRSRTVH